MNEDESEDDTETNTGDKKAPGADGENEETTDGQMEDEGIEEAMDGRTEEMEVDT